MLHGQTVLEDDRKLSEYSLPEGVTISALLQPDVIINIEVSTGVQMQHLTVSNATSIMALKVQICGVMRCGVAPERLELRLGDAILEDDAMPLHFYGITNGTSVTVLKPYVRVTFVDNYGQELYSRIERKDTIREVKRSLFAAGSSALSGVREEDVILYLKREDGEYIELEEDETVVKSKIKDDDKILLLSYRWSRKCNVTVTTEKTQLMGVDEKDTCLGIKLKVQDQMNLPVSQLRAYAVKNHQDNSCFDINFFSDIPLNEDDKPFSDVMTQQVAVLTEQEAQKLFQNKHLPKDSAPIEQPKSQIEESQIQMPTQEQMFQERRKNMQLHAQAAATVRGLSVPEYQAQQTRERHERVQKRQQQVHEKQKATAAQKGITLEEYQAEVAREQQEARTRRGEKMQARLEAGAKAAGITVAEYQEREARKRQERLLQQHFQRQAEEEAAATRAGLTLEEYRLKEATKNEEAKLKLGNNFNTLRYI